MPKHRGVRPGQDRLQLSEGDWIDVKRKLTVGESRDIAYLGMERVVTEEGMAARPSPSLPFMAAATYILAWSLLDYDGQPIPWPAEGSLDDRVDVLRTLDVDTMNEIDEALTKHRTPRAEPKNETATASEAQTPPATSGSEAPATGSASSAT